MKPARAAFLIALLALGGCVQSNGPILKDGADTFGRTLRLQLYGLRDGYARDPESVSFSWNGHHYARTGGGLRDVKGFTVHPFEGDDLIIQTVPAKAGAITEFAIAHRLAGGVWHVAPVDEDDADAATRDSYCKSSKTTCVISTRQQLLAFARATAAHRKDDGGLAIRLPDAAEHRSPRRR